jgi:hydrogenase nickel incorporation protein HypA/HybF
MRSLGSSVHELALAEALVAVVDRHARGRRVVRVELEVGRLRQVVREALAFSFELVAQGTPAEGAELAMEEIPIRLACRACGAESEADAFPLACGRCGALDVEVTGGEEFQLVALELEDEPVAAGRR